MALDQNQQMTVESLMNELRNEQKNAKKQALMFTGFLVVAIVGFYFYVTSAIRHNFEPEQISLAFDKKIEKLAPAMPFYLESLTTGIPQAMSQALHEELQLQLPQLQANLGKETLSLSTILKERLTSQLNKNLGENFVNEQLSLLKSHDLTIENTEINRKILEQGLNSLADQVVTSVATLYGKEFQDIKTILRTFPREKAAVLSEKQAAKLFAHYLLMVVDREIMKVQ